MRYIDHHTVGEYLRIIAKTYRKSFKSLNVVSIFYKNSSTGTSTKKSLPFWCILLVDCLLVFLSYMIVIWRMRSGVELLSIFYPVVFTLLFYLLFYAIGFKLFHTYSGILRYSSFVDLQKIGLAMLFGGVCAFLLHYIIPGHWFFVDINGNEIIFATLLASLLLWGERIFVKILYDVSLTSINSKYALIYGNGDSVALAKQIRNEKPTKFIVKGFLSENKNDTSRLLMGEKVYPLDDQLPELIEEKGIGNCADSSFERGQLPQQRRPAEHAYQCRHPYLHLRARQGMGKHRGRTAEATQGNQYRGPATARPHQHRSGQCQEATPRQEHPHHRRCRQYW